MRRALPVAVILLLAASQGAPRAPLSPRDLLIARAKSLELNILLLSVIARERAEGFGRFVDDDVAEAAGALAATLETARRGLIYEHAPQSLLAQRLITAMKGLLEQLRAQTRVYEGEVAIVLRAIEQAAKETRKHQGGDTAYLALVRRLMRHTQAPETQEPPASSLILPGT